MSDCESTRGTWGQPCPDCGQRLPAAPREWAGWRSERIDPEKSALAQANAAGALFGQRFSPNGWRGQKRARRAA